MPKEFDELPDHVQAEIRAAILAGRKIEAIKFYYEQTKSSLNECKAVVDQEVKLMRAGGTGHQQKTVKAADMDRILDAIFANRKLEAVKIYKELNNVSLLESKTFVDELIAQLSTEFPNEFAGGKGYKPGCVVLIAYVLMAYAISLVVAVFATF